MFISQIVEVGKCDIEILSCELYNAHRDGKLLNVKLKLENRQGNFYIIIDFSNPNFFGYVQTNKDFTFTYIDSNDNYCNICVKSDGKNYFRNDNLVTVLV